MRQVVLVLFLLTISTATATAAGTVQKLDVTVRGKPLTLAIYQPDPATPARGTVIMSSGDVRWGGLAVIMAEELYAQGYTVIGINSRQYLSAFTDGKKHLEARDVPEDFRTVRDLVARGRPLARPVILSGVSEGAAFAVLAASAARNHDWIDGVITMGLPGTAEMAWRWTDAASWITKRDPDEPSVAPIEYIAGVAPIPLVMLQSKKDEYVPEADYRRFEATAREPKKLVLIDASNHRFSDRRPDLRAAYFSGLDWIRTLCRPER